MISEKRYIQLWTQLVANYFSCSFWYSNVSC